MILEIFIIAVLTHNTLHSHPLPDFPVDLPNLYKRSIVFFRSLHSLVRLLPSHNLNRRLKVHDGEISLGYRLSTNNSNQHDEVPIGKLYYSKNHRRRF